MDGDRWVDVWMGMDGWMSGQRLIEVDVWMYGCMDVWMGMDGWTDGDGWMDGWMCGWGWMDEWTGGQG